MLDATESAPDVLELLGGGGMLKGTETGLPLLMAMLPVWVMELEVLPEPRSDCPVAPCWLLLVLAGVTTGALVVVSAPFVMLAAPGEDVAVGTAAPN